MALAPGQAREDLSADALFGSLRSGAIRKNRCLGAGFLFSHTLVDNRRFPTHPSQGERPCPSANPANGDSQRRPHSNRGIASRRSGPRSRTSSSRSRPNAARGDVIRTAEDFKSMEPHHRGSDQPTVGPPDGRGDASRPRRLGEPAQARSLAQGAGHTIKDQGRRDVTLRTTCGQVIVRATSFSRNCDRSKRARDVPDAPASGHAGAFRGGHGLGDQRLVTMLGSLEEVEQVLSEAWPTAGLRDHWDDRFSFHRACGRPACGELGWGEPVAGRRVVVSTDGGRIRIRTTKSGPKTAKERNRCRTTRASRSY